MRQNKHFWGLIQLLLFRMDWYVAIKTLHILSATVLFGTGVGIAFFMFRSWSSPGVREKLFAAENTVLADKLFTLPAVIVQPLSGAWLVGHVGYEWSETWLLATYAIYAIAGFCWLPVLWIQARLRTQLRQALETGEPLPASHEHLFRLWFVLGWPAFLGLVAVFYLMVARPG